MGSGILPTNQGYSNQAFRKKQHIAKVLPGTQIPSAAACIHSLTLYPAKPTILRLLSSGMFKASFALGLRRKFKDHLTIALAREVVGGHKNHFSEVTKTAKEKMTTTVLVVGLRVYITHN